MLRIFQLCLVLVAIILTIALDLILMFEDITWTIPKFTVLFILTFFVHGGVAVLIVDALKNKWKV